MTRLASFPEAEARRVASLSEWLFGYPTDGVLLPAGRGHDNLALDVRESALRHFEARNISWWRHRSLDDREPAGPTRLLRSSQVACVNHLEPARTDVRLARQIARVLVNDAVEVLELDGGFTAFEWIGEKATLGERGARRRGAMVTSLDALMVARRRGGERIGIAIEWKNTERYGARSQAVSSKGTSRIDTYRHLLEDPAGPIDLARIGGPEALFYDPFLQALRQTLLAWRLAVDDGLYEDFVHVQVIPAGNRELLGTVTSPSLVGADMPSAWRGALRRPDRYVCLTPSQLLASLEIDAAPVGWRRYLAARYAT